MSEFDPRIKPQEQNTLATVRLLIACHNLDSDKIYDLITDAINLAFSIGHGQGVQEAIDKAIQTIDEHMTSSKK